MLVILAGASITAQTGSDDLLEHVRTASTPPTDSLICDSVTVRYRKDSTNGSWQPRETSKAGVISPGGFSARLRELFASAPAFQKGEETEVAGKPALAYAFTVPKGGGKGHVWIAKTSGSVLRLEFIAADQVTTVIDYAPIDLGDVTRDLPMNVEIVSCQNTAEDCRTTIEFHNYRRLSSAPQIAFAAPPAELAPSSPAPASARTQHVVSQQLVLTFVGVLRFTEGQNMVMELDDSRFIKVRFTATARIGLKAGDRVRVQTSYFDGHSMVADSLSLLQASAPQTPAPPPKLAEDDAVIRQARQAAGNISQALPNFLCREIVKRYQKEHDNWRFYDTISAELIYSGKTGEDYRDIRIDGKPTAKPWLEIGGNVSRGEFGSMLRSLFSNSYAEFQFVRDSHLNGAQVREYTFRVAREHSDWMIVSDYQFIRPSYSGHIWFDRNSGNVLRVDRVAESIPSLFPIASVTAELRFARVHLRSAETYLLPAQSESLSCIRAGTRCNRNTIEFRDYKKFTGESKLVF
jgi:hypothetical protein